MMKSFDKTRREVKGLFLTYEGHGHLYTHSLFWPTLESVSDRFPITWKIWQVAPKGHPEMEELFERVGRDNVRYFPISPGKIGKVTMMMNGLKVRSCECDLLMTRSHVVHLFFPRLIQYVRASGKKWIWDMDGFMPDERVEFGGWSRDGWRYRLLKRLERWCIWNADAIVVRTEMARDLLKKWYGSTVDDKVFVVPNGKSPEDIYFPETIEEWMKERKKLRQRYGYSEQDILWIYAGSVGPQYYLDRLFHLVKQLRERGISLHLLLFVNQPDLARTMVPKDLLSFVRTARLPYKELAKTLWIGDFGISFRRWRLSQKGVFPIKNVEYLFAGLPVLSNYPLLEALGIANESLEEFYHSVSPESPDVNQLQAWIQQVQKHRWHVARKARQFAEKYLSTKHAAERFVEVLQFVYREGG